jgi:hypothetical protein
MISKLKNKKSDAVKSQEAKSASKDRKTGKANRTCQEHINK